MFTNQKNIKIWKSDEPEIIHLLEFVKQQRGDKYRILEFSRFSQNKAIQVRCNLCNRKFCASPAGLYNGHYCPTCGDKPQQEDKRAENFVIQAMNVHGSKYRYTTDGYINSHTNVRIYISIFKVMDAVFVLVNILQLKKNLLKILHHCIMVDIHTKKQNTNQCQRKLQSHVKFMDILT